MTDHLERRLGVVLIALAAILGPCPAVLAQRDTDRALSEAGEAWKKGSAVSREKALGILNSLGRDAAPARSIVMAALQDPDAPIRAQAAGLVGEMRLPAEHGLHILTELLKDPNAEVRDAAASAIPPLCRHAEPPIRALVESLRGARPAMPRRRLRTRDDRRAGDPGDRRSAPIRRCGDPQGDPHVLAGDPGGDGSDVPCDGPIDRAALRSSGEGRRPRRPYGPRQHAGRIVELLSASGLGHSDPRSRPDGRGATRRGGSPGDCDPDARPVPRVVPRALE